MNVYNNLVFPFISLCLISLIIGIMLTIKGRPYSSVLSTLHKLSSFTIGVLFCFVFYNNLRHSSLTTLTIVLAVGAIIFFIVSTVTGSILISSENVNPVTKINHRIFSIATYLLGIISIFMSK